MRDARPSFLGLELSEGTRGCGNPSNAYALESAAFSLANIPMVLEWRTVLRGQGSSGIDQKLDRMLCQVMATAGALLVLWLLWAQMSGIGSSFLPLLMLTSARHPLSTSWYQ